MANVVAAHPDLYDPSTSEPLLRGERCVACDTVFFPPLRWGCEVCGAHGEQLTTAWLSTRGVLRSFAVVHIGGTPDVPAPYTIGEILLDEGPLIRGLVSTTEGHEMRVDQRVHAVWRTRCQDSETAADVVEPCFEPEKAN